MSTGSLGANSHNCGFSKPTYMLTSTNMNASIFWKEIVQFSQRMILISWLFFCITYLLPTYTLAVFF